MSADGPDLTVILLIVPIVSRSTKFIQELPNCRTQFSLGDDRYVIVRGIAQFDKLILNYGLRLVGRRREQTSHQLDRHDRVLRSMDLQNRTPYLRDSAD